MGLPFKGKAFSGLASDPDFHGAIDLSKCFAIPANPHPGSFAFVRKNHVHEGVDIYCMEGDEILSMTSGTVEKVLPFTGPKAGFPWWLDTEGVAVRTLDGTLLIYGEIKSSVRVGDILSEGDLVGTSIPVLANPKGYPPCMLHVETYSAPASWSCGTWPVGSPLPEGLLDPTPLLLKWMGCDISATHSGYRDPKSGLNR